MAKRRKRRTAATGRSKRPAADTDNQSPRRRWRSALIYALVFVAAAAFFAGLQFRSDSLVGFDGYYHIKYGYILRTHGWQRSLPWLRYTIHNTYYRDHHFLFHLLLVPLTLGAPGEDATTVPTDEELARLPAPTPEDALKAEALRKEAGELLEKGKDRKALEVAKKAVETAPNDRACRLRLATCYGRERGRALLWGAKIAATLFPALMALSFFALLRAARVPWVWLWMIALAGAGTAFLYRMLMTRPMAGAVALLLLAGLLLIKRRYRTLGILTMVGVWYYDGYGMMVILAVMFFVAHWLVEGRPNWRPIVWCLGGAAVGIIVNPYFPRNVQSYIFNVHRSFSGMETEMGGGTEWRTLDAWTLVTAAPGAAAALLVVGVAGRWCRRPRPDTVAFILMTALGFLMACKARRYMEYYPPLAVMAAALTVRDFGAAAREDGAARRWTRWLVPALSILMAATAALTIPRFRARTRDYRILRGAAEFLAENSSPGDLVLNPHYDDFPPLFFYNHRNHYAVGLDPIYLHRHNATLFSLWRGLRQKRMPDAYGILEARCRDDEKLLSQLKDLRDKPEDGPGDALRGHFQDDPYALKLLQVVQEGRRLGLREVLKDYFKAKWVVVERKQGGAINFHAHAVAAKVRHRFVDEHTMVYAVE